MDDPQREVWMPCFNQYSTYIDAYLFLGGKLESRELPFVWFPWRLDLVPFSHTGESRFINIRDVNENLDEPKKKNELNN